MLDATKRVLELWDDDEFQIFIINGSNGYGKSTLANRIISEVYSKDGVHGNWDISLFKEHMGFHPVHVYKKWMSKRKRDKVYHWDDAGVWLNALDYQDPFVKAVGKYLQTARTKWACIIFSAIDRDDVVSKIRNFKSTVIIDVTKEGAKKSSPYPSERNHRTCHAWHYWKDRLGKQGNENDWSETFNCHVPDKFYEWYYPIRKKFANMSEKLGYEKALARKDIAETMDFIDI